MGMLGLGHALRLVFDFVLDRDEWPLGGIVVTVGNVAVDDGLLHRFNAGIFGSRVSGSSEVVGFLFQLESLLPCTLYNLELP